MFNPAVDGRFGDHTDGPGAFGPCSRALRVGVRSRSETGGAALLEICWSFSRLHSLYLQRLHSLSCKGSAAYSCKDSAASASKGFYVSFVTPADCESLSFWDISEPCAQGTTAIEHSAGHSAEAVVLTAAEEQQCLSDRRIGTRKPQNAGESTSGESIESPKTPDLGQQIPKTPEKAAPKSPPKSSAPSTHDEAWGKRKAAPLPPAAPTPPTLSPPPARIFLRGVTVQDLDRLRGYPALLPLAEMAFQFGPCSLNTGQQASLGLIDPAAIEEARRTAQQAASSALPPRARPRPPSSGQDSGFAATSGPIRPAALPENVAAIVPKPGPKVKARPKVATEAPVIIHSDSDRD